MKRVSPVVFLVASALACGLLTSAAWFVWWHLLN